MTVSIVSGQGVRLRAQPSGLIIGSLDKGVRVASFETANGWTRVEVTHGGVTRKGWVSAKFLQSGAAAPQPLTPAAAPAPSTGAGGLANGQAFFARVGAIPGFNGQVTPAQRAGCEAILTACAGFPIAWAAYVLATAAHETGRSFAPGQEESLNYSVQGLLVTFSRTRISRADCEALGRISGVRPANQRAIGNRIYGGAWGKANLGNTQPDDGYNFRGRGWVQITGRANYAKADKALGLGGKLVADPSLVGQLAVCAGITVRGMREGWFTGHKLADHVSAAGPTTADDFVDARLIINRLDKAEQIAQAAAAFQEALLAGGWR